MFSENFYDSTADVTRSVRDPSAMVYRYKGTWYRRLSDNYIPHYRRLMDSGLYDSLRKEFLIIDHEECDEKNTIVLRPSNLPFISMPWEWTFSALKDAALTTLRIMEISLEHDMVLKDAVARNIQFVGARPVFIDTSSFEIYDNGPWKAYRQFCEQFLAPLALQAYGHPALGALQREYIDGIPLSVACRLLPLRSRLHAGLLLHLHGHARFSSGSAKPKTNKERKTDTLPHLLASIRRTVSSLHMRSHDDIWSGYDGREQYPADGFETKKITVASWGTETHGVIWDIGAHDGMFSRLASTGGAHVVAWETDHAALEHSYHSAVTEGCMVLPLRINFNNPSGGAGLGGEEIPSVFNRGTVSGVMMLAVIHHLCVTQNVSLEEIARLCKKSGASRLLIEWVAPDDAQAALLLRNKTDHHPYDRATFDAAFTGDFMVTGETALSPQRSLIAFRAR